MSDEMKKKGQKALNDMIDIGTLANLEIKVFQDGDNYCLQIICSNYYSRNPYHFTIPKKNVKKDNWDLLCLNMATSFYEEAIDHLKEVVQSMIEEKHNHEIATSIVNKAKKSV